MKKVIITMAAVIGLASGALAFTPSTQTDEQAGMVEQNAHNHAVELNSHEGHQHNVGGYYGKWECLKCGNIVQVNSDDLYNPSSVGYCPANPNKSHDWKLIWRR